MAGMVLTSCNDDGYWEQAAPNQVSEVSFDQTSTKVSVPMADETTQFAVKLTRGNANGTVSIPVTIETATPEVLSGAENVEFADGQTTADYIINVTDAEPGITYTAKIKLEDKYNTSANNITTTFSYNKQLEFTPMGTGYLIDGTVSAAFNLDNTLPYAVEIEFAKTSKATIYRFIGPWSYANPEGKNDGHGYIGYVYNEDGDGDEKAHWFEITCTGTSASMAMTQTGMNWGYGACSIGSIYGNLSSNIQAYPLGIYDEAKGVITFPANSLVFNMADEGNFIAKNPTILYLSLDAFSADNE
jgi:hypothetical protein